jgi:hypothetical protein
VSTAGRGSAAGLRGGGRQGGLAIQPPRESRSSLSAEELARAKQDQLTALRTLRRWYQDWATTFREVFGTRVLIRLGLATLKRSAAEDEDDAEDDAEDETTDETDEDETDAKEGATEAEGGEAKKAPVAAPAGGKSGK